MIAWIVSNAANIVLSIIIAAIAVLAARYIYKKTKSGGCVGCKGNCHSCHNKNDSNDSK